MKCPTCVEEGERSQVYGRGSETTLMGGQSYYDEDGEYHNHDPNYTTRGWDCSRGHRWSERYRHPCPAEHCSWNAARSDNA